MSGGDGLTDERAALMIEMLGKILDRFDAADARMEKVEKLLLMMAQSQREQLSQQRDAEGGLATMRRDDLQILVRETASLGAELGMNKSLRELEGRLTSAVTIATGRDLSAVERLQASADRMTARITSWPSWGLLAAFFVSSAAGATTVMAIFVHFWVK